MTFDLEATQAAASKASRNDLDRSLIVLKVRGDADALLRIEVLEAELAARDASDPERS